MPIAEVRIEEDTWANASPLRRQEWRTLIADLLDEGPIAPHSAAERMIVGARGKGIRIELVGILGESAGSIELAEAVLGPHMSEYLAIIRKMVEKDMPAMRLEALDMAKKVVHDHGAKAIAGHAAVLADKHEAFRRLFSLAVALCEDTTMLPPAHRHRL